MSLSATILNALAERAQLKAQGFAGPDLDCAFEKVIRECWPFSREWHYNCTACNDTGWEHGECDGGSACGPSTWRPASSLPCPNRPRKEHAPHSFVRVCFCAKGQDLKKKMTDGDQDFSSATKSKPRKTFGRFGNE